MINLIKMDLYRLFHSKSIRVGLIAACLISLGAMVLGFGIVKIIEMAVVEDPTAAEGMSLIFPMASWLTGVDYAEIVLFGTKSLTLFVGCMITAAFVGAEQSCGYIKNIAGQLPNRGYSVISKFVVTSFSQALILLVYTIVCASVAPILYSQYIDSYSIGALIGALVLRLLLHLAINAVILFLCTLTKSNAIAMVTGAVFGIGITGLAYLAINGLFRAIKLDLNISDFMPDGINGLLAVENVGSLAGKAILVSVVFITGFLVGAVMLAKKRDIK